MSRLNGTFRANYHPRRKSLYRSVSQLVNRVIQSSDTPDIMFVWNVMVGSYSNVDQTNFWNAIETLLNNIHR